jgi:Tfp pilus assembly protein PilF
LKLNRLDEAQAQAEKAVEITPDDASGHFVLAQLYRKRGLSEKAKAELDRFSVLNQKPAPH